MGEARPYDLKVAKQIEILQKLGLEIHIPKRGEAWFCKSRRKSARPLPRGET